MIATSQFTISVINDGAPGQQGVSVSNVIPEYRLSDSSTELTGDTTLPAYQWNTTKPEVPSGKYIWTRNRNELSNGTTVYSDAVCDVVTSGLVFDVDRNTNAITQKVWQTDITTSINSYDSTTTQGIRDRVTQTETDISGINTTISEVQSTLSTKADGSTVTDLTSRVQTVEDTAATHTRQISETNTALGNTTTTANQTADQLSWVIDTAGKTSSTFTFKNRVMELVNADLVIKDPSGNSTVISGGNIQSNSITTAMLATDAIKSTNYVAGESGSPYSSVGTFLDLSNGNIYMPNFGVGQVNGNDYAYFRGSIISSNGTIGGWTIGSTSLSISNVIEDYGGIEGNDVPTYAILADGANGNNDVLVVRLGDEGNYTYPFYVRATGELHAEKATISGQINADTGSFGGANGFIIASNKIYSNGKSTATSTNNGIYIGSQEGIYLGAYDSTTGSCPFQVTNAGVLYCSSGKIAGWTIDANSMQNTNTSGNAVFFGNGTNTNQGVLVIRTGSEGSYSYPFYVRADGTVHAVKGDIAGWTLNANGLYKLDGTISIANSSTPSSSIPGVSWSHIGMTMKNSAGTITADYGLEEFKIAYSSNYIDCTCYGLLTTGYVKSYKTGDAFAAEVSSASGLQYRIKNSVRNCSMHLNDSGLFGLYDDTNSSWVFYSDTSGNVSIPHRLSVSSMTSVGSVTVGSTASGGTGAVYAVSAARRIALHANAAGNCGLYDTGNDKWILVSGTSQSVSIPHPLSITGTLSVSSNLSVSGTYILVGGTTATTSPYIQVANNKNNVALNCTQSLAGVYHYGSTGSTTAKWLIYIGTNGTVTANTSDIRYKNIYGNISEYETLTMLRGLDVINFSYKEDEKKIVQNGFKAQQMRDLLKSSGIGYRPYLDIQDVTCEESEPLYDLDAPEGNVLYGVDYSRFTPLLVSGWQIHDSRINELEAEIASLRSEIAALKRM